MRHPHGSVHTEVVGDHVLHVTVDRQEKRNALTPKLLDELGDALTRLDDDPDLWVGVLTFAGAHTTAGLDLPLFLDATGSLSGLVGRSRESEADRVDPFGLGRRLAKPLVTAVQGITFTAGIEIALAGDIVVAADDARFCQMEPRRGLAAGGGATFRYVERAGWGNAMYHLLRVDEFTAAEAHRIGLVQEVVAAGDQIGRAIELAREIAANAPLALQHTKRNARLAVDAGEQAAVASIGAMWAELLATDDFAEGLTSFVERRAASFSGR